MNMWYWTGLVRLRLLGQKYSRICIWFSLTLFAMCNFLECHEIDWWVPSAKHEQHKPTHTNAQHTYKCLLGSMCMIVMSLEKHIIFRMFFFFAFFFSHPSLLILICWTVHALTNMNMHGPITSIDQHCHKICRVLGKKMLNNKKSKRWTRKQKWQIFCY